jgi:CRISPR/Cas system type I-B associated protein Csh2 (Cas7 group RAMP superfamily)
MTTLDRCLYLMGLNLSNRQIAYELGLNEGDAQNMTRNLRQGVVDASTTPTLSGTVEIDEVYLVAGHKGQSDLVKKNTVQDEDDV